MITTRQVRFYRSAAGERYTGTQVQGILRVARMFGKPTTIAKLGFKVVAK